MGTGRGRADRQRAGATAALERGCRWRGHGVGVEAARGGGCCRRRPRVPATASSGGSVNVDVDGGALAGRCSVLATLPCALCPRCRLLTTCSWLARRRRSSVQGRDPSRTPVSAICCCCCCRRPFAGAGGFGELAAARSSAKHPETACALKRYGA